MSKLTLYPVSSVDELVYPEQAQCHTLESRALNFFTDFYNVEPLIIDDEVSAVDARNTMIRTHVRLKLVVDKNKQFIGIISAKELSEQNILARSLQQQTPRDEIRVADLMIRKTDLLALHFDEVNQASIGDVVQFLKDNHQQHCLVLDGDLHQIRGIFSASDISRKLKLPLNIHEQTSFSKVFDVRSEEHTSELQSRPHLVCRLLLEK